MPTSRARVTAPLAAALAAPSLVALGAGLALGACARPPAPGAPAPVPAAIHFDNAAPARVYVYLLGERREWLLGRVEPGARATLRLPAAALAEGPGFVRLAVLAGEGLTLQAARDPRARVTIAQPAAALAAQRWTFAQGELTPLRAPSAPER
jgi:hypothetical protein